MSEFRLGWGPLLAATVGTMCGIFTLTNYSQGFFVGPVITEFGWSAPQFFLSYTILMCLGLVTGPIIGSWAQKSGLRTIGIIGLIGHSLGYFLLSFNNGSLPLWYASWALLSILGAGSLPVIWTGILNDWFKKHRGKAIGITMAGTGLGAFLLPPFVEFLISNYGWRTGYRGIGIAALLISLPIVFLLFKERTSFTSDSSSAAVVDTNTSWGMTRGEAMKTHRFWILGAVLFLTVIVVAGLLSNFPRIMTEHGFERAAIAKIAAIMGLTVIIGRVLVGALVDRFWAPGVAVCFFVLPTIALLMLVYTDVTFSAAILIGIMIGLAAGAELDLLAFLTSKYFGPANYPKIFGGIIAFFMVGAGIAPPLFGAVAQAYKGYDTMLMISVGLLIVSMLLFLALGKYPENERVSS